MSLYNLQVLPPYNFLFPCQVFKFLSIGIVWYISYIEHVENPQNMLVIDWQITKHCLECVDFVNLFLRRTTSNLTVLETIAHRSKSHISTFQSPKCILWNWELFALVEPNILHKLPLLLFFYRFSLFKTGQKQKYNT